MQTPVYKIVVIGETEIGKTTFIKRLIYNLNNLYIIMRTLGVDVEPLEICGNTGKIKLNLWDCGGNTRGLCTKYYTQAFGAIIFKRNCNNNHLIYEDGLPDDIKKFYITDFDMKNPEYTIKEYKTQLYEWVRD